MSFKVRTKKGLESYQLIESDFLSKYGTLFTGLHPVAQQHKNKCKIQIFYVRIFQYAKVKSLVFIKLLFSQRLKIIKIKQSNFNSKWPLILTASTLKISLLQHFFIFKINCKAEILSAHRQIIFFKHSKKTLQIVYKLHTQKKKKNGAHFF